MYNAAMADPGWFLKRRNTMKKTVKMMAMLAVIAVCMIAYITPAQAAHVPALPDGLYLTQNVSGTCTLCASAMMIRASLYQHISAHNILDRGRMLRQLPHQYHRGQTVPPR